MKFCELRREDWSIYQEICITGEDIILNALSIASPIELLCMKLYAMITRKKWKDAVDVYFLLHHLSIPLEEALTLAAKKYYIRIFNPLAVLEQLIAMDWDMSEAVNYLIENPPSDLSVAEWLRDEAIRVLAEYTDENGIL